MKPFSRRLLGVAQLFSLLLFTARGCKQDAEGVQSAFAEGRGVEVDPHEALIYFSEAYDLHQWRAPFQVWPSI